MPKEALILNGFGGGLNEDADEADVISTGEGKDEVVVSTNLLTDLRGKVVAEYPVIQSLSGVATVDSLGPISASWQATKTHTLAFTQKGSQSGGAQVPTGTGIKVTAVVDGSGDPTFTIVEGGAGYLVDDTIIFVDPGSTSNEATLVVATLNSTAIGVTVDSSINDATSDKLLYNDDKLYQGTGIYKLASDINYKYSVDYLASKPTTGRLNPGSIAASYDGNDLEASFNRNKDILVWLGKGASQNTFGAARVFDQVSIDACGLQETVPDTDVGPMRYIQSIKDKTQNGRAGVDADFWTDTGTDENIYVIDADFESGTNEEVFITENEGSAGTINCSADTGGFNEASTAVFDEVLFAVNGYTGHGLSANSAGSATDDSDFVVFRVGAGQYTADTFEDGAYGKTLPNVADMDIAIEFKMFSESNIEMLYVYLEADGPAKNYRFEYADNNYDDNAKIWKITPAMWASAGADSGYARIILPYEAAIHTGDDYTDTGIVAVAFGYSCSGNKAATTALIGLRELTFINSEPSDWNKNTYKFYNTYINSKELESLPFEYGDTDWNNPGDNTFTGLNYPTVFKLYRNLTSGTKGKLYYHQTDEVGTTTGSKLLLAEYDFTDGVKPVGSDDFTAWSTNAATATITITAYTELNNGDKVNLIATDGTNYDFVCGSQSSVSGTWEATTSNDATATNLMNVINTSSGPSGTRFTATVDGAVVTATQATTGDNGNTIVTLTDSGTAGMSKTNFTAINYVEFALDNPPVGSTYALESGYPSDTTTINAIWNSAAVVGRQAYIGNCGKGVAELRVIGAVHGGSYDPSHAIQAIDDGINDYFHLGNHDHMNGYQWCDWTSHGFAVGQIIVVSGFSNSANNGAFKIHAIANLGNDNSSGSGGNTLVNAKMTVKAVNGTDPAGLANEDIAANTVVSFYGFDSSTEEASNVLDGSLILKSSIGNPAGFSDKQFIDMEFGGDSITYMTSSGDRLFVFSERKLTIINVAQGLEFIEATLDHNGVSSSKQVCKVGEGVAYINQSGVNFFDGEQLQTLTNINMTSLTELIVDPAKCAIGFDSNRSILYVWLDDTNLYYFSLVTGNWIGNTTITDTNAIDTNVVNGKSGYSFYEDEGKYYYIGSLQNSSARVNNVEIKTGKISCGNIAQDKKFYKINVTLANGVSGSDLTTNLMRLYWRTNESTSAWTPASDADDNGSWLATADGLNEIKLSGAKGKWIQLKFVDRSTAGVASAKAPANMSIGDISVIYRGRIIK